MHNTTKNIKLKVLTHKRSIKNTQPDLLFTKHSAIIPQHINTTPSNHQSKTNNHIKDHSSSNEQYNNTRSQNVAEPKVDSLLISLCTYVIFIFSIKFPTAPKSYMRTVTN